MLPYFIIYTYGEDANASQKTSHLLDPIAASYTVSHPDDLSSLEVVLQESGAASCQSKEDNDGAEIIYNPPGSDSNVSEPQVPALVLTLFENSQMDVFLESPATCSQHEDQMSILISNIDRHISGAQFQIWIYYVSNRFTWACHDLREDARSTNTKPSAFSVDASSFHPNSGGHDLMEDARCMHIDPGNQDLGEHPGSIDTAMAGPHLSYSPHMQGSAKQRPLSMNSHARRTLGCHICAKAHSRLLGSSQ